MNFFLADVQTAFGAFVAFYLADLGWPKGQVGLALGVGTLAGVISQIPGGALVDAVRWKRGLTAIGIGFLCLSAVIFALMSSFALVFVAELIEPPVMLDSAIRNELRGKEFPRRILIASPAFADDPAVSIPIWFFVFLHYPGARPRAQIRHR
jgi:MFS family permease